MDLPLHGKRCKTFAFALSRAVVRRMPLGATGLAALAAAFSAFLALAGALVGLALALLAKASILAFSFALPEASAVLALAFAFATPLAAFALLPVLVRIVVVLDIGIVVLPGLIGSLLEGQVDVACILRSIAVEGLRPRV